MNHYLAIDQPDQQQTQLTVRSGHLWRTLPWRILSTCFLLPVFILAFIFVHVCSMVLTGMVFQGFRPEPLHLLVLLCGSVVLTGCWFSLMRVLLVPTGRLLTRGRLERKIGKTADRHQVVHLLVRLASINDRLGRRVIGRYYRQATAILSDHPVDLPLLPIPKADVFMACLDGQGFSSRFLWPNFGWLTLTPNHLAHETDILCLEDSRVVIRLEDICNVEVNRKSRTLFLTIDFECDGKRVQIRLTPKTRFDVELPGQSQKKLALWKLWIEEAVGQRKQVLLDSSASG